MQKRRFFDRFKMVDYYRKARRGTGTRTKGKYLSSTSERILERICHSFGTELREGYVSSNITTLLTRMSNPASVTHPDGRIFTVQFQYTRFSPMDSERHRAVYNRHRSSGKGKRELSEENVDTEIYAQHPKWDTFREVTDPRYIEHLWLHRWQKTLYLAAYEVKEKKELEPFLIHPEAERHGELGTPDLYIIFNIEPIFSSIHSAESRQDIYDHLRISFPKMHETNQSCLASALALHPVDNLKPEPNKHIQFKETSKGFGCGFDIHCNVSRSLSIGLVAAYFRKFCMDKGFY
jgi:hypothetical protein